MDHLIVPIDVVLPSRLVRACGTRERLLFGVCGAEVPREDVLPVGPLEPLQALGTFYEQRLALQRIHTDIQLMPREGEGSYMDK